MSISMYRARSKLVGQPGAFETVESLWSGCVEYFEWVENEGKLYEYELVKYLGEGKLHKVPKMRAMSKGGLCIFLCISLNTWERWKMDEIRRHVCNAAENIIREQKFSGASAGLLHPVIIARDLGLVDGMKHEVTGKDGGPISLVSTSINVTRDDLKWVLEQL